jgi:hypothetical protein
LPGIDPDAPAQNVNRLPETATLPTGLTFTLILRLEQLRARRLSKKQL